MVNISPIRLFGFTPHLFFRKLSPAEKSVAYFTSGLWTVIAWNPKKTFVGTAEKTLKDVKKSLPNFRKKTELPFTGGAIGRVSYDAGLRMSGLAKKQSRRSLLPEACFHLYDSAVLFDGKRVVIVGDSAFRKSVRMIHDRPLRASSLSPIVWSRSISRERYMSAFRKTMRGIRDGDFYQMNLTYPFEATTENASRNIFSETLVHNPASAAVYLEHGREAVISASPERFVLIEHGLVTASPIKGTRPRGRTPREDRRFMTELLRSPKEQAELNMITDLLRSDIGKVSEVGTVRVRGYRLLQKNPSVWHTYSVVEGAMKKGLRPLDAFLSMFPSGSITGCPKLSAMETIDALEESSRGLYCGSAVMLSTSGRLDSTVLIRTIVNDGRKLSLGVGGGIVVDSDPEEEFRETKKKAQRILSLPVRRTWINGQQVSDDPRLEVLDPSKQTASGVFETMRADHGQISSLGAHLRRLKSSASILGQARIPPERRLRAELRKALKLAGEGPLRIKLVISSCNSIIETCSYVSGPSEAAGVSVSVTDLERAHPEAKALPYHREWEAYGQALASGFRETLLRCRGGTIPEASISNLFFVKRGTLFTPRVKMLKGITRAAVLRDARSLGIRIAFRTPVLSDLHSADEVFLTRSLAGVIPVVRIGRRMIGLGKVGRMTKKLQKKVSARVGPTL